MTLVYARPERAESDIKRAEEEAAAFWAGLPRHNNSHLRRLIERESFDYKLLMADKEGREWAGTLHDTEADRRARRAARVAADPLAHRRDENLRHYVDQATRTDMPVTVLHRWATNAERVANQSLSTGWFRDLPTMSRRRRARVLREEGRAFEQWLLINPQYGPMHDGNQALKESFEPWHYRRGSIRPAGMTPERALQVALEVLESRGGTW